METKNKTKIMIFAVMLALPVLIFSQAVQAQTAPSLQPKTENRAVTVATVNIFEAKITSQAGSRINISFDISNRDEFQPQIRYAVKLLKTEDKKQTLADQKIYDEVFDLGRGETLHKEIEYQAPGYLNGDYQVILEARNSNGLGLALALAGTATLQGDGQFLEILPDTCYLSVQGDAKKYTLIQGVDVSREENLVASCEVKNNFQSAQVVTPQFATYHRTSFGKLLSSENQNPVSFQAGEKKTLSLTISKAPNPQAYDAMLTLLDGNQKPISNSMAFHYVLRGASATIQNLRLNKDYYAAGETANILFDWTGSADSFPGARVKGASIGKVTAVLGITSSKGQACSDAFEQKLAEENQGDEVVRVLIKTDCSSPTVAVQIKDASGNILDQSTFEFQTSPKEEDMKAAAQPGTGDTSLLSKFFLILAVLIIILGAFVYYFRRRNSQKRKNWLNTGLFLLAIAGAFLLGTQGAKADSFEVDNNIFYVNLDKGVYQPGEAISVTGSAYFGHCSNWLIDSSLVGTINNSSQNFFDDSFAGGSFTPITTLQFVAPTTPGSYDAVFTANSYIGGGTAVSGTYVITYTVASGPSKLSLSFWADPSEVYAEDPSTTLYWKVKNAVSCQASGEDRRIANPDQGIKYLSDLNWSSESVDPPENGPTKKDQSIWGNTITLDGKTYSKGLGTNANSDIEYDLNGQYKRLITDLGIDDEVDADREDQGIQFRIWGGYAGVSSKKIFDSHYLTKNSPIRTVDLDMGGFKYLELYTSEQYSPNWTSHADWAGARLVPETVTDWSDGSRDATNGLHTYAAKPGNGTTYSLTCRDAGGATITQHVRVDFVPTPMGVALSTIVMVPNDGTDAVSNGLMDINKKATLKFVVDNADGGWWNYPGGGDNLNCADGSHSIDITDNSPYDLWVGLDDGWNISCRNDACQTYCNNTCGGPGDCENDCEEFYKCDAVDWYRLKVIDCTTGTCVAPTATLTANPNPVNTGNASTLTWTTSNATSCWASDGNAGDGWQNTDKAWSDGSHSSPVTVTKTSNKTYSIECWNDGGVTTGKKSVTIGLLGVKCDKNTSCAATTCIGDTCSDGCGGTVPGAKACYGVGNYQEVAP